MIRTRIVAGADGSAGSIAAVRWAATEALLRDAELHLITAYHRHQDGLTAAAEIIRAAVAQARATAPGLDVRGVTLPGYAAPVLLQAAREASLLVVGDRTQPGLPGLPFGAVSSQVATHARCSVVVVRGHTDRGRGPVVVGVDDSPAADAVIGRAFEEASLHGADVVAVTAGRDAELGGTHTDAQLEPWRLRYGSVTAQREYVNGRPDKVMVDSCREARLAVVGPRGHGFQGVLLGAIGSRLLRRADCPVLISR
jgi:nucleotide-binding universal stress UspA family protein